MNNRGRGGKLALVGVAGCLLLAIVGPSFVCAQSSTTEDWEKAAGGKMSFEVASVKPNDSGPESPTVSNFLPGPVTGHHEPPNGHRVFSTGELCRFRQRITARGIGRVAGGRPV